MQWRYIRWLIPGVKYRKERNESMKKVNPVKSDVVGAKTGGGCLATVTDDELKQEYRKRFGNGRPPKLVKCRWCGLEGMTRATRDHQKVCDKRPPDEGQTRGGKR